MAERRQGLDLPSDLVYSILLRLPVKSLTRLKSVSKSWYDLISHPSFQKDHYLHHKPLQHPLLLLLTETGHRTHTLRFSTFTHDFTPLTNFSKTIPQFPIDYHVWTGFSFTGSCLGLVCIASASDTTILVCNPSTQEIISLPPPPVQGFTQCVGFGYAASVEDFKVFRFFNLERYGTGENCCEVFALGSDDGWRKTSSPPYIPKWHAPLLHGAVHLMPKEPYGEGERYHFITAFNIDSEKHHCVPFPQNGEVVYFTLLVVLRGSLCIAFCYKSRKMFELWFLKDYDNGKWAKEYNIDVFSVDGLYLPMPVEFLDDGSILMNVYLGEHKFQLCRYNTQGACFKQNEIYENCSIRLFVESFLRLRT